MVTLVPPFFVALAVWLDRGMPRARATVIAVAAVALAACFWPVEKLVVSAIVPGLVHAGAAVRPAPAHLRRARSGSCGSPWSPLVLVLPLLLPAGLRAVLPAARDRRPAALERPGGNEDRPRAQPATARCSSAPPPRSGSNTPPPARSSTSTTTRSGPAPGTSPTGTRSIDARQRSSGRPPAPDPTTPPPRPRATDELLDQNGQPLTQRTVLAPSTMTLAGQPTRPPLPGQATSPDSTSGRRPGPPRLLTWTHGVLPEPVSVDVYRCNGALDLTVAAGSGRPDVFISVEQARARRALDPARPKPSSPGSRRAARHELRLHLHDPDGRRHRADRPRVQARAGAPRAAGRRDDEGRPARELPAPRLHAVDHAAGAPEARLLRGRELPDAPRREPRGRHAGGLRRGRRASRARSRTATSSRGTRATACRPGSTPSTCRRPVEARAPAAALGAPTVGIAPAHAGGARRAHGRPAAERAGHLQAVPVPGDHPRQPLRRPLPQRAGRPVALRRSSLLGQGAGVVGRGDRARRGGPPARAQHEQLGRPRRPEGLVRAPGRVRPRVPALRLPGRPHLGGARARLRRGGRRRLRARHGDGRARHLRLRSRADRDARLRGVRPGRAAPAGSRRPRGRGGAHDRVPGGGPGSDRDGLRRPARASARSGATSPGLCPA